MKRLPPDVRLAAAEDFERVKAASFQSDLAGGMLGT